MMSAADEAYAEAQRLIAKVKASGSATLDLNTKATRALDRLPDEIGDLPALRQLILIKTQITDLVPLAAVKGLTHLSLDSTQITDLTPLAALKGLIRLTLNNTKITDLAPLAALTGLAELYINSTQITDLTPLAALAGLIELYANEAKITNLVPLTVSRGLSRLDLSNNPIIDIAPLASLTGLTGLFLSNTQITDLAPLAALTGLHRLILKGTQITDLTPLAALTKLAGINLDDSAVLNLLPLRDMPFLAVPSDYIGLTFKNTAATRADKRISEIAEIADNPTRARELFEYLKDWVPPIPADLPEAPSFHVPDQGPVSSGEDPPQGGDEDQEELRQDLVRKAAILVGAIGDSNQLAILAGAAQHYQKQVMKDLPRIRLNLLYSAANSLRTAYEANAQAIEQHRPNDQLPPLPAAALIDLVETHALFFAGFPDAADVHEKMLSQLAGTRNRKVVEAAQPIVESLARNPNVLDSADQEAMADDLAAAKGEGRSAEIGEKRLVARLVNMLSAVGRKCYLAGQAGTAVIMSHDIPAWFLNEKTAITSLITMAQGPYGIWITALMGSLFVVTGISQEIAKRYKK